jgi:hypothetical protein
MPPALDFLLRIALGIQGLLCFHMYFVIDFSISVQNVIGRLIGIVLNIQFAFGSMTICIVLILPVHEHGRSFHLLMSSLISVFSGLQFSLKRSLSLSLNLSQDTFFEAIVNGILSQSVCFGV